MTRMGPSLLVVSVAFLTSVTLGGQQAGMVDMEGQTSKMKAEEIVAGHLQELNGHYKLRVSELTFEPGAHIGPHHHAGPGIRCVTAGQIELTFEQPSKSSVYSAGECFFESGDVTHTTRNRSGKPVLVLNFEILPATWSGGSAIPVPK